MKPIKLLGFTIVENYSELFFGFIPLTVCLLMTVVMVGMIVWCIVR